MRLPGCGWRIAPALTKICLFKEGDSDLTTREITSLPCFSPLLVLKGLNVLNVLNAGLFFWFLSQGPLFLNKDRCHSTFPTIL